MKCVTLAHDGIHAVLLVLSVMSRFSEEEASAVQALQSFFGPKITDYMTVVFTNGDAFEEDDDSSFDDYLTRCPQPLKDILKLCNDRCVLIDNKTKDVERKMLQLGNLLFLVDNVIEENGGNAYTNSLFADAREVAVLQQKKEEASNSKQEKMQKSYDVLLKKMTEMIEGKMTATSDALVKELERERAARKKAEKDAREAKKKSDEAAKKREQLQRERNDEHNARMRAEHELGRARAQSCAIM